MVLHRSLNRLVDIGKALSDPNRVRAFVALSDSELCLCQLIELLNLAPSTVSKHMSVLKQAGLVESRKDSRWVYYRLVTEHESEHYEHLLEQTLEIVAHDPHIQQDREKLASVIDSDIEELCRMQRPRSTREIS